METGKYILNEETNKYDNKEFIAYNGLFSGKYIFIIIEKKFLSYEIYSNK